MITEQEARDAAKRCELQQNKGLQEYYDDELTLYRWAIQELARREAERAERAKPITREWLQSLGSERVPDEMFPHSSDNDNEKLGRLIVWEFGYTGVWHVRDADWMKVSTRGQLLDILAALKGGAT